VSAVTLPLDTLRRAVLSVAPAAVKSDSLPVLASVHLTVGDGVLAVAATDRRLLLAVEADLPECNAETALDVLPRAAELAKWVKVKPPKTFGTAVALARLSVAGRLLTLEHGVGSLEDGLPDEAVAGAASVRLVEGDFPRHATLWPSVPVDTPTALTALSPVLLARASTAAAQVLDRNGALRLWAAPAVVEDGVTLPERGATRPVMITATGDEGALRWKALLMPVRLPAEATS
jgi:hypothetical protein